MTRTAVSDASRKKPTATGRSPAPHIVTIFKTLGDYDRLRIYHLLVTTSEEICVCELVDALRIPQYQVSRHLQNLKRAGLVSVRRKGTWAYYSIDRTGDARSSIANVVGDLCTEEVFNEDKMRLSDRFTLRRGGRCVVGFTESREKMNGKACNECAMQGVNHHADV
jgi:DNA-binding transcriptional ArsR family regulator